MTPKDLASLIDRFQILFDRPSTISEDRGLAVSAKVTPEALREFIEATRELDGSPSVASPLPRSPRRLDD